MKRALIAAVAALAVLVTACGRAESFDPASDPAAVVLVKDGRSSALVVVDLERFRIVRRVRLRSQSFSIDGDVGRRIVASAQCGGLDQETDDACAIYELGERKPTYVELAAANPLDVAVADGTAYLVHGLVRASGLQASMVDLGGRCVSGRCTVPVEAGRPERVGGRVLLPVSAIESDTVQPGRLGGLCVMARSRTATLVAGIRLAGGTLVASSEESRAILAGWLCDSSGVRGTERALALLDTEKGVLLTVSKAPWLTKGPEVPGCMTADGVAIADSSGNEPEDTGHDVVFLDPLTLVPVMRRTLEGMPSSVAAWGRQTLVVDGKTGELLLYREGRLKPSRRLKVAPQPNLAADMVVFPQVPAGGDSVNTPR